MENKKPGERVTPRIIDAAFWGEIKIRNILVLVSVRRYIYIYHVYVYICMCVYR